MTKGKSSSDHHHPEKTVVLIENLKFKYPTSPLILDIPEFKVHKGEHVFLHGPSGSGKTTLLGILTGILKAQDGHVRVLGKNLHKMNSSKRDAFRGAHLGYIFQMFNLIPYLHVAENITLPCRFSKERRRKHRAGSLDKEVLTLAEHLGIEEFLHKKVTELSVGQQQRVAVARALMGRPELIIADEPTSALDHDHRERFIRLLFQECNQNGATVIFVSHDKTLEHFFDRSVSLAQLNQAKKKTPKKGEE